MAVDWLRERRPRTGRVSTGKDAGASVLFEPDGRDPEAWHLYISGGPRGSAWDVWIDNAQEVLEWLADPVFAIRLD